MCKGVILDESSGTALRLPPFTREFWSDLIAFFVIYLVKIVRAIMDR